MKHPGRGRERGISSGVTIFFPTLRTKLFDRTWNYIENDNPVINKNKYNLFPSPFQVFEAETFPKQGSPN